METAIVVEVEIDDMKERSLGVYEVGDPPQVGDKFSYGGTDYTVSNVRRNAARALVIRVKP
jgi:hypothetical protein